MQTKFILNQQKNFEYKRSRTKNVADPNSLTVIYLNSSITISSSSQCLFIFKSSKHTCKINLGLEREQSQSQAERSRDTNGHEDPIDIIVDGNTGDPEGQGDGENSHGDQVSGEFSANGFAACNGKVTDEKDDVGDNVDDEAIVTGSQTVTNAIGVIFQGGAVEFTDLGNEDKDRDEGDRDAKLAEQSGIDFANKLKVKKMFCNFIS